MKSSELKKKYIEFFKKKNHKEIMDHSLIPENDPTVLFTTAGMHPLVPYLLGQKHAQGKRLVNSQKCLRTDDIDEVGDDIHLTFFEMLGNWSLRDYWKEEAINYTFEFFTKILKIDKKKLNVTCFKGDKDAPKDSESYEIFKKLGIPDDRIYFLGKKENWWGPAGKYGPCGPCSEIFYDTGKKKCSKKCNPSCSCGKFVELGNNVFMEYNKTSKGFERLKQGVVDFGGGYERLVMLIQKKKNVFETDLFENIIKRIKKLSKNYNETYARIIADHLRACCFILDEKVKPSNVEQGYILRRLLRRGIRYGKLMGMEDGFVCDILKVVIKDYGKAFKYLNYSENFILREAMDEEKKFEVTLEKGLIEFEKLNFKKKVSGKDAFYLYQSFGFPIEVIKDLAKEKNLKVDEKGFNEEFVKHQEVSRKGSEVKFKSGLSDSSEEVTNLHTATHLLHKALQEVLGGDVKQKGSNITKERLRFDFSFDRKLTDEEVRKVEGIVNSKIKEGLDVVKEEMSVEEAKKKGADGVFENKYGEKVSVYSIGDYSKEICAGPHVKNTNELGRFKIIKEQSVSAGVRRIKAILE
ncbi:MAG: alanine--tRNA ligase [Nanoarchaeota archaeon]|nr:alanine--tRNA ligase [Nanoarchaeota archaeon]